MDTCPECGEPVKVWADTSGGVTVNFRCDNEACRSGKGPWDTDPLPARFEERNGKWVVIYMGTVVGRHTAKFRAKEQAALLNDGVQQDDSYTAER